MSENGCGHRGYTHIKCTFLMRAHQNEGFKNDCTHTLKCTPTHTYRENTYSHMLSVAYFCLFIIKVLVCTTFSYAQDPAEGWLGYAMGVSPSGHVRSSLKYSRWCQDLSSVASHNRFFLSFSARQPSMLSRLLI